MRARSRVVVSLAIVATGAVGCREPSPPPNVATETLAPVASPTAPAPPAESNPRAENRGVERLSDDELVTLLIDSKLQKLTPEAARERLASTSDPQESSPTSDGRQLRLDRGASHLRVSYMRGAKGEWLFGYARATIDAATEALATQSYERFEKQLGVRFGKPAWKQDGVVGWTVGEGAMEVSLLQRQDEKANFSIEATLAEPQGESEK